MTRTVQQLFDLSGKTALVTGGSRGLGLQMAHALGEAGAKILLSSRKAKDLEEAAAELQAAGIEADWVAADCSDEADITRLAKEAVQRLGHVDILINNAGASWGAPAISTTAAPADGVARASSATAAAAVARPRGACAPGARGGEAVEEVE